MLNFLKSFAMRNPLKSQPNSFLKLLQDQDTLTLKGLDLLKDYMQCQEPAVAQQLTGTEKEADEVRRILIDELNRTFVTPMDREDIHALGSALDDVLDLVDAAASRLVTYKVTAVTPGARQLSKVILHGTEMVLQAVSELNKPHNILEYCEKIAMLEEEADRIKGECVARLFENSANPIEIIKWKEIYEVLEATTDKCEDVADVLEAVVLKAA